MTKTSLVKGTAVLAAAGLFVKFLGAFFRIPLANMIGAGLNVVLTSICEFSPLLAGLILGGCWQIFVWFRNVRQTDDAGKPRRCFIFRGC